MIQNYVSSDGKTANYSRDTVCHQQTVNTTMICNNIVGDAAVCLIESIKNKKALHKRYDSFRQFPLGRQRTKYHRKKGPRIYNNS